MLLLGKNWLVSYQSKTSTIILTKYNRTSVGDQKNKTL